jgi:hypothetical protein
MAERARVGGHYGAPPSVSTVVLAHHRANAVRRKADLAPAGQLSASMSSSPSHSFQTSLAWSHCTSLLAGEAITSDLANPLYFVEIDDPSSSFRHPASVGLLVAGCAGHSGAGNAASCSTVAAAPKSQLPHVVVLGASATAITQALDAVFASQTPSVSLGEAYALQSLECADLETIGTSGYECSLQVATDGGQLLAASANAPSALAQNLFNAVTAAGSTTCVDPHGVRVVLENVTVSTHDVQFDDASNYQSFPAPNVVARGADAHRVISALAAAGISDCDSTRSVFLICNSFNGAPNCGYQWLALEKVGPSELVASCGPGSGAASQGATLDTASSVAIWQSLLTAATVADFQPSSGTIEQTTVVNARYFSWDGSNLGVHACDGRRNSAQCFRRCRCIRLTWATPASIPVGARPASQPATT